jgi:SAM-dependent methyltransferase
MPLLGGYALFKIISSILALVSWSGYNTKVKERPRGEEKRMNNRQEDPGAWTFDAAYQGIPPWDIGRPQQAYLELEQAGKIQGSVLDVGCGTGEHALYLAQRGHEVWGIDSSPTAIQKARDKAASSGVTATFHVADALHLEALGRTFEMVIDSGLFHVFSDEARRLFVTSLAQVLQLGGTYYLLCFSDQQPGSGSGPRRVSQAEIAATFQEGWRVKEIQPTHFETTDGQGAPAWLASIIHVPGKDRPG